MEITIKATPEEIAALVAAIQERHEECACMADIADIPTTKTDVLSARIENAPYVNSSHSHNHDMTPH